ncbi:MAG: hypothetical protein NVS2B17_10200 [Candidatus Velthaea sp.]
MNVIRLLTHLPRLARQTAAHITDPRVPLRLKLIAAAGALFILSPLNILGDIPLLGMFDDVALLGFLADWFVRASTGYVTPHAGNRSNQSAIEPLGTP